MRNEHPYDLLAAGKNQGAPLLAGGEQRGAGHLFGGEQRGSDATTYQQDRAEQHPPRPTPASPPVPFRSVRSSSSASAFDALTVSKTRRC
jgi:hypothetical protein